MSPAQRLKHSSQSQRQKIKIAKRQENHMIMKQLVGIKSTIDFTKLRHEFREHKQRVKLLQSYKPNEW